MIEPRRHACFPLEARESVRISGEFCRKHFDGHRAVQPCVMRAVHLTHAAFAELGEDLVRP